MEHCTESEALQGWHAGDEADDWCREQKKQNYTNRIEKMKARYKDNKRSDVGTTIRCACCNKRILKKSYQTQFCSNKGSGNCKDKYWNNTNDQRRLRTQVFTIFK